MKDCPNHHDKKALFVCHQCGESFCELCVTQAGELMFCLKPECRAALENELSRLLLPETIQCPKCSENIMPGYEERITGSVHCTECGSLIDFTAHPPAVEGPMEFVQLFSSLNQGDIAVIKSVFDDTGIDYYILGENFLSVEPLIQPARFYVIENRVDDAKELLKGMDIHIYGVSAKEDEPE